MTYSTGTIRLEDGSPTVTGTGTAFVGNVETGDIIRLRNGLSFTLANVISDTEATLVHNFSGTTQSGALYTIDPGTTRRVGLNNSVQQLITDYSEIANEAGQGRFRNGSAAAPGVRFVEDLDSGVFLDAQGRLGASTGGVARWLLSSAAMQVNVPMTGAAVQASRTDTTAGRLARADYVYGAGNLIGTVSRSGTTVTGAVIESGETSDGWYVRLADGTQWCWVEAPVATANTSSGSDFISDTVFADFPIDFTGLPAVVASARFVSGSIGHDVSGAAAINTARAAARLKTTTSGAQGIITFVAVGRHNQGVTS